MSRYSTCNITWTEEAPRKGGRGPGGCRGSIVEGLAIDRYTYVYACVCMYLYIYI